MPVRVVSRYKRPMEEQHTRSYVHSIRPTAELPANDSPELVPSRHRSQLKKEKRRHMQRLRRNFRWAIKGQRLAVVHKVGTAEKGVDGKALLSLTTRWLREPDDYIRADLMTPSILYQ